MNPAPLTDSTLVVARKFLRQGYSLKNTAERLNVPPQVLDLALWRTIGGRK
jgi:thermostable 8-oxoguanine DNA glycosylase